MATSKLLERMSTSDAPPLARITDVSPAPEERFFVLGGELPAIAGANFCHARIGSPCAAIILINHIEPAELAAVLGPAPDPAVPIADFEHNSLLRHDFVGASLNVETIAELKRRFAPVWRRLAELPFRAKREDREELTMLRLAYSRDAPIEAVFSPSSSHIVEYPLLGTAAGTRRELELLADLDLLHRRHFTRTHVCSKCGSARLHVYEACPGCGGADLLEEELVHHYRCGCQEPESRFAQGQLLVCPKCRRALHRLGVADIGYIEDRIRKAIHDAVVVPLELTVDVAEGDAIEDMLAEG